MTATDIRDASEACSGDFPPEVWRELEQWRDDPPLASQMPLVFPNGARVPSITADCGGCKKPIQEHYLRGRVYWPMRTIATVTALGGCPDCKGFGRYNFRLREDGDTYRAEWRDDKGNWCAVVAAPAWKRALLAPLWWTYWAWQRFRGGR